MKKISWVWAVPLLIIILDQWSKQYVLNHLPLGSVQTVIPGFFDLVHYRNPGAAFGMLANLSEATRSWLFYVLALVAGIFLAYYWKSLKPQEKLSKIAVPLVYGGIIGNIIDRIRFGNVVDFLSFHWREFAAWPAFNVADSAITVAVVLLVIEGLRGVRKS